MQHRSSHKPTERLWSRDFILLGASILLLSVAFYILMPTLPIYVIDQLGADNSQLGLVIAVYTLAALLVRPFSGIALDLFGRRGILMVSVLLFTIFFLGYKYALVFGALLAVRFLHGLQWGVATSAYFTAAVDVMPQSKRGRGIGYFGLAFNIAMATGPALGLFIMGDGRFDLLFYSGALLAALGGILLFFTRFPKFQRPANLKFTWKGMLAKKTLPITLNVLLVTSTFGAIVTFLPIYARDQGQDEYTALYFILMALGMGLSRIFSGQIFDRFGPRNISIFGIISAGIGFWLLASVPGCSCFLVSSFFIGIGIGIVVPVFQTMANNVVVKERRGVANSTFLTGLDLGIGLGSLYAGWISDVWSLSTSFMFASGLLALSLIIFLFKTAGYYNKWKIDE